jgi:hypothetical protein
LRVEGRGNHQAQKYHSNAAHQDSLRRSYSSTVGASQESPVVEFRAETLRVSMNETVVCSVPQAMLVNRSLPIAEDLHHGLIFRLVHLGQSRL